MSRSLTAQPNSAGRLRSLSLAVLIDRKYWELNSTSCASHRGRSLAARRRASDCAGTSLAGVSDCAPCRRGQRRARSWQRLVGAALAPMSGAEAIISRDCPTGRSLWGRGERCGAQRSNTQEAILRQLGGGHSLLVMGLSPRPGDQLFFGQLPAELLERAECSVLFVASEPPTSAQSPEKSRDWLFNEQGEREIARVELRE